MKETFTIGEDDLPELAGKVASLLSARHKDSASVVLLEGDLGSGKTTFAKALAERLGIERNLVHSPTFILKKEYGTSHPHLRRLVHVDAYRFLHPDEASVLKLEHDLKDPAVLLVVEWPSKMPHLASDIEVSFRVVNERTREISIAYEEGR
jgi:tRNA threonylcarbamoyl adenosine modification protein YjeE